MGNHTLIAFWSFVYCRIVCHTVASDSRSVVGLGTRLRAIASNAGYGNP